MRRPTSAREVDVEPHASWVDPEGLGKPLRGERSVTAETALRLGRYLGTGAAFWMNLQTAHDISLVEVELGRRIEEEIPANSP